MSDPTHPFLPKSLLGDCNQPVVRDFLEHVKNMDKDAPAPSDLKRLRRMLDSHPELWRVAGDLAHAAVLNIVNKLEASPPIAESIKHGCGAMKGDLGYQHAPPLERLLIEQVVLCWLHLHIVDLEYTNVIGVTTTLSSADHWERRLSAAQRRYLRACQSLARIRKLTRTTPALQVNIATHGGQQVNVIGDLPRPIEED